jgi:hypothetical protein
MRLRNLFLTHVAFFAAAGAIPYKASAQTGPFSWSGPYLGTRRRLGELRPKRFRTPAVTSSATCGASYPYDSTIPHDGPRKRLIRGERRVHRRDSGVQLANGSVGAGRGRRLLMGQHRRKFGLVWICAPAWMRHHTRILRNAEGTSRLRAGLPRDVVAIRNGRACRGRSSRLGCADPGVRERVQSWLDNRSGI